MRVTLTGSSNTVMQWHNYYRQLQNFIKEEPGVEIRESLVNIEESARKQFYKLFNAVRASFLAQHFSTWLDEAEFLSTKYMKAADKVSAQLCLRRILMPIELERFLLNPMGQVIRDLFDPLFELLQGKIELDEFEQRAIENINVSSQSLYQRGYIKWFVLSLMERLDSDKIYDVPLPQPSSKEIIKHRKDFRQIVPLPEETECLGFEVGRRDVLLAPDFIVHSNLLGKYIGFRTEIGKAIWEAGWHSEKREWFSIASIVEEFGITDLNPDLLLYIDVDVADLSLVADSNRFCRPDLMVEFFQQSSESEESQVNHFNKVRLYHKMLQPVRGTCVISEQELAGRVNGVDKDIHIIHFGFNNLKWDEILKSFIK